METSEWIKLVEVIEDNMRFGRLKLEKLRLYDCNIDDELKERVRRFNHFSSFDE